jgi:hypothetical protein
MHPRNAGFKSFATFFPEIDLGVHQRNTPHCAECEEPISYSSPQGTSAHQNSCRLHGTAQHPQLCEPSQVMTDAALLWRAANAHARIDNLL